MLKRIILSIPFLLLFACLEESSEKIDKKAFTKIYDNSEFYSSFYTIDMKQTSDGGYLILGGKTEVVKEAGEPQEVNTPWSIYLLKTDKLGNLERELQLDEAYSYPIGNLNQIDGSYYFFCMDAGTNVHLVNVDERAEFSDIKPVSDVRLPLASSVDGPGLLLLSYDNETQESVLSRVSIGGIIAAGGTMRFSSGSPESPVDGLVVAHATRQGTQFPFSVGKTSGGRYYFNGFRDHTFSLVFTNLNAVTAVINGHQQNAGFSSVLPVSDQSFAVSTFSFGFNSLLPSASININDAAPKNVTEYQALAHSFPELENNARVKAIQAVVKGRNVILYGSNTKSGQIGLYIYDQVTGEFLSSKYLGYSNLFEIGALIQTVEGDIAISGTTYIAGRLPRVCLIKVPKDEIKL